MCAYPGGDAMRLLRAVNAHQAHGRVGSGVLPFAVAGAAGLELATERYEEAVRRLLWEGALTANECFPPQVVAGLPFGRAPYRFAPAAIRMLEMARAPPEHPGVSVDVEGPVAPTRRRRVFRATRTRRGVGLARGGMTLANGAVEADARKLLTVLAGKECAREGGPVSAGPDEAAAAGFGAGTPGERLHRAVWRLIADGSLEAVLGSGPPADVGPRVVYRVTRAGLKKARGVA